MGIPKSIGLTEDAVNVADERTPLLGSLETSGQSSGDISHANSRAEHAQKPGGVEPQNLPAKADEHDPDNDRPMPTRQVLLLCFVALQDPVACFAIFPFINQMIERTGDIEPADVGFWTGAIESLYSFVQMLVMLVYGRIADRIGRKPVLVFSLAGVSVASAIFGTSKTLWQMLLFRSIAGFFSGGVVIIRTMISENTTKTTQAKGFGWYMFARNTGILIGPILGGLLSNPATQYTSVFGNSDFLREYPYVLPGFAVGALGVVMTLAGFFGLNETLQEQSESSPEVARSMTMWEILKAPGVAMVLWIYTHVMLVSLSYTAVSPVFMYTPINLGGFAFDPQHITLFLAIAGGSQAAWMLFAFPFLQRRFGTGSISRACSYGGPLYLALWPIMNEFLRAGWTEAFWAVAPPALAFGSAIAMNFACVQLMLNDISPSPAVNATLNGIALALVSGIRASMPAVFTSIFAFGVKWGAMDGHFVWVCLIILNIAQAVLVQFIPAKAEGAPMKKKDTEQAD